MMLKRLTNKIFLMLILFTALILKKTQPVKFDNKKGIY